MRVLVTGGAGFIGSHLVRALLSRGDAVAVLDNLSSGRIENLSGTGERLRWIHADLRDQGALRAAVEGAEVVFHLAALPSVARSVEDPSESVSVNEVGTVALLAACRKALIRRLVYSSSSSVYGDSEVLPKSEGQRPAPLSPYAAAKLAGEYACRALSATGGPETVCLRYFNVYGPRQDPRSAYAAVISAFCDALVSGRRPVVYGDGYQTRDFTCVDDVVRANLAAAEGPLRAGEPVNIARGQRCSVLDLLGILQKLAGADLAPRMLPERPGDVRDSQASVERARSALGFEARIPLVDGLRRTLDWHRAAPAPDS